MKKCCGNCKWHQYDDCFDDWVCENLESNYCSDYTGYNDCCEEFEEKE